MLTDFFSLHLVLSKSPQDLGVLIKSEGIQLFKGVDTVELISYLLKQKYGQQIANVWADGLKLMLRMSYLLSIKFEI